MDGLLEELLVGTTDFKNVLEVWMLLLWMLLCRNIESFAMWIRVIFFYLINV